MPASHDINRLFRVFLKDVYHMKILSGDIWENFVPIPRESNLSSCIMMFFFLSAFVAHDTIT